MQELIERIERNTTYLRAMQIMCEKSTDTVAKALEPGLEKIALELTDIGLCMRHLQTD